MIIKLERRRGLRLAWALLSRSVPACYAILRSAGRGRWESLVSAWRLAVAVYE